MDLFVRVKNITTNLSMYVAISDILFIQESEIAPGTSDLYLKSVGPEKAIKVKGTIESILKQIQEKPANN